MEESYLGPMLARGRLEKSLPRAGASGRPSVGPLAESATKIGQLFLRDFESATRASRLHIFWLAEWTQRFTTVRRVWFRVPT
jgi:hypothetical protein